jgi:hypothetical protein
MTYGKRVEFEEVREVAFGGIGVAYAAMGPPLTNAARILGINNTTDAEVYLSFDGVTNRLRLAAHSFRLYDIAANKVDKDGYFLPKRTTIFQKRVSGAPTMGDFWIEIATTPVGT